MLCRSSACLRHNDVRFETVTLDDLLVSTAGVSLRLVILDACRNKPAGALDAADGSVNGGSFGDLNEEPAGALCGGTTAAGRKMSEQPVHGGVAVAFGNAPGDPSLILSTCGGRLCNAVVAVRSWSSRPKGAG